MARRHATSCDCVTALHAIPALHTTCRRRCDGMHLQANRAPHLNAGRAGRERVLADLAQLLCGHHREAHPLRGMQAVAGPACRRPAHDCEAHQRRSHGALAQAPGCIQPRGCRMRAHATTTNAYPKEAGCRRSAHRHTACRAGPAQAQRARARRMQGASARRAGSAASQRAAAWNAASSPLMHSASLASAPASASGPSRTKLGCAATWRAGAGVSAARPARRRHAPQQRLPQLGMAHWLRSLRLPDSQVFKAQACELRATSTQFICALTYVLHT